MREEIQPFSAAGVILFFPRAVWEGKELPHDG